MHIVSESRVRKTYLPRKVLRSIKILDEETEEEEYCRYVFMRGQVTCRPREGIAYSFLKVHRKTVPLVKSTGRIAATPLTAVARTEGPAEHRE